MTDWQLLQKYLESRDERAFAELIERHFDWISSAVRRQVHDAQTAEDVTQAVFIALTQQARHLHEGAAISTWLFQVMRYACTTALRAEARRKRHERKAAAMISNCTSEVTEAEWEHLAPVLDELVEKLRRKDREAVLLRFYQRRSFVEVGQLLGISEEAARKRCERAVETLRQMFQRRGLGPASVSSAVLAGAILAHATKPAGAAAVAQCTRVALAGAVAGGSAAAATAVAKGAIKMIAWAKIKWASAAAVLLFWVAGTGLWLAAQGSVPPTAPTGVVPTTSPATPSASATIPFGANDFTIAVDDITLFHDLQLAGADAVRHDGRFQLVVTSKPQVPVIGWRFFPDLETIIDENGVSLLKDLRIHQSWNREPHWTPESQKQLLVPLELPPGFGHRIARLKGTVHVAVLAGQKQLEFKNILQAREVSQELANCRVSVHETRLENDAYQMKLTVVLAPPDRPARDVANVGSDCFHLLDAAGRKLAISAGGQDTGTATDWTVSFARGKGQPGDAGEPARLVVDIPTDIRDVAIPFEFRDLPLP